MRNRLLCHVNTLFDNIGLDVQDDSITINIWRYVFICVMILLANISLVVLSIANYNDFNKFVSPAPYTAAAITTTGGLLITYIHRKTIGRLLHHLHTNPYIYPDEDLIKIKYKWYIQENTIFLFINISFYGQIFILAMLSLPAWIELIYYGRIYTFMYPLWSPWKVDNLQKELAAHALQIVQCSCGIFYSHVMTIFIVVVLAEFVKQYERLYVALSSLTNRSSIPDEQNGYRYEELMRQNIIHCVRHHQMIYKSVQYFKIWFTAYFSLELAVCLLTFAFALYVLVNSSNIAEILTCFIAFFFIWFNFLTRCLISELFTYLNDHLAETIYLQTTEWLNSNRTNRRLHLMFHQLVIKPQQLNAGLSVFEANRSTLSKIIRFVYSSFNVFNFSRK